MRDLTPSIETYLAKPRLLKEEAPAMRTQSGSVEASVNKRGMEMAKPSQSQFSSVPWHCIARGSVFVGSAFALRAAFDASSTLVLRIWAGQLNASST